MKVHIELSLEALTDLELYYFNSSTVTDCMKVILWENILLHTYVYS